MERPLRCHLHVEALGARPFRLIVPRPLDGLVLSTNRYHETWHVICAPQHVRALRRLVWAAAFDRHPDTLFVVSGPSLAPTPFDAARSDPLVIACSERTHVRPHDLRTLLRRLARKRHPAGTVKLRTVGMERTDALEPRAQHDLIVEERSRARRPLAARVERLGGAIVLHGPAAALRHTAMSLQHLEAPLGPGESSHHYVGVYERGRAEGEVQVFSDYFGMLTDARLEREMALAEPGAVPPHAFDELVCRRRVERSRRREQEASARRNRLRALAI